MTNRSRKLAACAGRAAILAAVTTVTAPALAQIKAFPEAEGFGRLGLKVHLGSFDALHLFSLASAVRAQHLGDKHLQVDPS